jgi:CHAD domain-containing protein
MATGIETERKFALAKGQGFPRLGALGVEGPEEQRELVSVYYDTPDSRLNAAGQSIRRRSGGPDSGWQAKLPTDNPDARLEVQLPPGGDRMPLELRELVSATVGEQPLFPVAELHTHRSIHELRNAEGVVLATISSDQVTATVAGHTQEWVEAEIELVDGDSTDLDRIEAVFLAAGIRRSANRSKLAQALAEQVARREEPDQVLDAARVIRAYLGAQVGVLQALEIPVLRNDFDAVHRCRVATRRLRSTLRTFDGAFRSSSVRAFREELRWHAELLGAPRDAEVLAVRLSAAVQELPTTLSEPVAELISEHLTAQKARAHQDLVAGMVTERYRRLCLDAEQFLADPPLDRMAAEPAAVLLPKMLADALQRARVAADRAESRPSDLTRWHELRKAAKAARYGAEALLEVLPEVAGGQAAAWSAVTTALGEAQDAVIAVQVISELSWKAVAAGTPRQAFDELRSRQDALLREALAQGRQALKVALAL